MNFCATKFISFVAFEQLNRPTPSPPFRSRAARMPAEARSRASSQVAARSAPFSRTNGSVSRVRPFPIELASFLLGRTDSSPGRRASGQGDALGMRIDVEPAVADEADHGLAQPLCQVHRERRGRRYRR